MNEECECVPRMEPLCLFIPIPPTNTSPWPVLLPSLLLPSSQTKLLKSGSKRLHPLSQAALVVLALEESSHFLSTFPLPLHLFLLAVYLPLQSALTSHRVLLCSLLSQDSGWDSSLPYSLLSSSLPMVEHSGPARPGIKSNLDSLCFSDFLCLIVCIFHCLYVPLFVYPSVFLS